MVRNERADLEAGGHSNGMGGGCGDGGCCEGRRVSRARFAVQLTGLLVCVQQKRNGPATKKALYVSCLGVFKLCFSRTVLSVLACTGAIFLRFAGKFELPWVCSAVVSCFFVFDLFLTPAHKMCVDAPQISCCLAFATTSIFQICILSRGLTASRGPLRVRGVDRCGVDGLHTNYVRFEYFPFGVARC